MSVNLGDLPAAMGPLELVTTHFDPRAKSAGRSFAEAREAASLTLSPAESKAYLEQLRTGQIVNPLGQVFHATVAQELLRTCSTFIDELNALGPLDAGARRERFVELLTPHDSRIFDLMHKAFSDAAPNQSPWMRTALSAFVSPDPSGHRGLSRDSEVALDVARAELAQMIAIEHEVGLLDAEGLAQWLGGSRGMDLVLRTFVRLVEQHKKRNLR